MEPESAIVLASARGEVEVFARTIALLEEKLVEVHQTRDTSEVNSRGLSDVEADVEQQWEESERESEERVQELTHPETSGFELCQDIVSPPRVRSHMSEGMWITALHNTEMAE
jgi:hypothetical protein